MFDIKSVVFNFLDVSIYCVGYQTDIDMLIRFFDAHKGNLKPKVCTERIIFHSIYTRFVSKHFLFAFKYWKHNQRLKDSNLLMDLSYFDEAMFISNPQKIIETLGVQNIYGENFKISQYWKIRFPHFPDEFPIE